MKKKLLFLLVLVTVLAGGAFAQEESWGGKKNHIALDLGLLVAGARYERFLNSQFSVGGDVSWANSFILFNELEFGAFGRWYPWKGLYAELGLGFHIHTGAGEGTYSETVGGTTVSFTGTGLVTTAGVGITPGVGYKFDPGNPGGFYVEPGISVPITIGKQSYWTDLIDEDVGVKAGFVLFCGLGWAL
jgi:hypothetical protein